MVCCWGLIDTGATFSTGGREAHGDLTGVGAEGFATSVGFSENPFRTSPPVLGRPTDPTFKTVAFGPIVLVGLDAGTSGFAASSWANFAAEAAACSSANAALVSVCGRVIFVPSFHSIVSGAQSSSSSSISAHASLPSPSAWSLVARCIPYCCFNSSSVKCFCAVGAAAEYY